MSATTTLEVFFGTRHVGTLEQDRASDRMFFGYAEGWLEAPDGFAISASLPLRAARHDGPAAHAFFQNLLPEGAVRQAVARRLGLSEGNDFALLRALGGDCAGALTLLESPLPDDGAPQALDEQPIDLADLAHLAREGGALSGVSTRSGVRLSLAGAQDKLPVRHHEGRFALPLGRTPSTHIVKLPNPSFAHLPENELFSTAIAAALGLPTCDCELVPLPGERSGSVLVVRRYDRALDPVAGEVRLHQEDLCQALGLPPTRKYEEEGGPSFAGCVRVVTEISSDPARDVAALVRWITYCALLGNADGHAKNLSLLRLPDGRWRLAPFYDLVCTAAYPKLDRNLAMRVGSTRDPGQIRERDWSALATECSVAPRLVRTELRDLGQRIEFTARDRLEWYRDTYGDAPFLDAFPALLRRRARRLQSD